MATTTNLDLFVTDDNTVTFKEWREQMNATSDSNMTKIDDAIGSILSGTAGVSSTVVVDELPEEGDESTDYILSTDSGYVYYKYIDGEYVAIGGDAYTKDEVDELLDSLKSELNELIESVENEAVVDVISNGDGTITIYYGDSDQTSKIVDTCEDIEAVAEIEVNEDNTTLTITYTNGDTKEISLPSGGGTTTTGSATITRITSASTICIYGESCPIEFTFTATDSSGDTVGDGTATWYINSVAKTTSTVSQGDNSFDVGEYLSSGSNTVKLSISVDTGGDTNTTVTKTWTVNAVNMYLTWSYDETTVNDGDDITLYWTPYGADITKTSHILIDDEEVYTSSTSRSGTQQSATIDITGYSHGSHTAEIYLTATVGTTEIQSASIIYELIIAKDGETDPIISISLTTTTMTQYNTLQIPIIIYDPDNSTVDATLYVNGETVAEWTDIDRTVHYWNYTPSDYGEMVLTVTCGTVSKSITITVEELDIDNDEITGYAFRLKASDLASNEALEAWESNGVTATFSDNFDWDNGGIQSETDDDGNIRQYVCIKAGTTMTIDYQLFGGTDPKTNGRSFKCIFKVVNSRDYDAIWLDCYNSDSEGGLQMGANETTVNGSNTSTYVEYTEDTYIEFEFDIRASSVQRYLQTYLDGVLTTTVIYSESEDFNQTSDIKSIVIGSEDCDVYIYMIKYYETYLTINDHMENFIADAPNATEMLSRYERNDVLNDNGDISYSKLASVAPDLRIHLWDIPRMSTNKIKKDPVSGCSYKQLWHSDDPDYSYHQISAEGVTIGIQGTSSLNYLSSAGNTDGKFSTCTSWVDGDGNDLMETGYSMTETSIPVDYFNTKVNVASCENINNMCLAEWYNRYQPYETLYHENYAALNTGFESRDCMELHMGVQFISDQSGDLFDYDGDYHMYAICNMGNSKNNIEVFHDTSNLQECCVEVLTNDSDYCKMIDTSFDLELLQSEEHFEFRYSADDADSDLYTDEELEEAKSAQEQAFIDFVLWFAEGNPAAYTDEDLEESVTYGSYTFKGCGRGEDVLAGLTISEYAGTYTTDSYEYRMAKMLSECEDHLIMDSVVYHYVFVEEHTMVDNVCKNTFWSTEDLQHWQLTKNYDNDTADGIDNNGILCIPYGCEGLDWLSDTRAVFNGQDAAWWNFIYGLYDARQLMWQNRESAGAWDIDAYLDFVTEYQDLIPERVWNQDYWYKYLRLYEEDSDSDYLTKLESGKKTHQRTGFVTNNMYYMAGQYMGSACTSQSITLRAYTPSTWSGVEPAAKVEVALYTNGYIVTQIASTYKRQKAEKGVLYTIEFEYSGSMNDTVVNIHGANLVQQIGDISCLYVGYCSFSAATRLRSLQIGSTEDGYSNENLTSVAFGSNEMLEYLYIQNCPNATVALDLSGCPSLKELDTRGSGFTGVTFATGGVLEVAYLNALTTLVMRSLNELYDDYFSLEDYTSLSGLRIEDCENVDSLALIQAATNLTRLRAMGIDWTISETDILNTLLELAGYDENSTNVSQSVLGGTVTISGDVRQTELDSYDEAWPDLIVKYSTSNLVETYLASYYNIDGTLLYSCYVDQGDTVPDPVELGYIDTPTYGPDEQYIYTYSGWDNISGTMTKERTITAVYTTETRTYTINWYRAEGDTDPLYTIEEVEYGTEAVYDYDNLGLPVYNSSNGYSSGSYRLFTGWDVSTGYITGDIDVYAQWQRAAVPNVGDKDLSEMSVAEIYGICTDDDYDADDYFEDKDYIDIVLGHDFDFSNVESTVLLEDTFFDGATAITTDVQLFSADSSSFTLVIDYEFMSQDETSATLVSCYETDGNEGFRLRYSGTGESGYPNIQWGDKSINVGYGCNRNIVVLRHEAGSNYMTIYPFNKSSSVYDDSMSITESVRSKDTEIDDYLTFGAIYVADEDAYTNYASGWIYQAKIYYDDLGDHNAQDLAAWPRETLRMEFAGADRYYLEGSSVYKANGSFYANNPLSQCHCMNSTNTNEGGWDASAMRTFVNDRVYNALPFEWQAALKKVKIVASEGSESTATITSTDYIFLPAYQELTTSTLSEPYASEGTSISYYTSNASRIKFPGIIREDDAQVITSDTDPTMLTAYKGTLKDGDIWINSYLSSRGYMYISADTLAQHSKLGNRSLSSVMEDSSDTTESANSISASDGGVWLLAYNWWERSPYASSSTYFMFVSYNGDPHNNHNASDTYGVVVGFAI